MNKLLLLPVLILFIQVAVIAQSSHYDPIGSVDPVVSPDAPQRTRQSREPYRDYGGLGTQSMGPENYLGRTEVEPSKSDLNYSKNYDIIELITSDSTSLYAAPVEAPASGVTGTNSLGRPPADTINHLPSDKPDRSKKD